jgi:hypothetical protein
VAVTARWQRATPAQVIQVGVGADLVAARAHDGTVHGWSFAGDAYGGLAKIRAWRIAVAQRARRLLVEHEDSNSPHSVVDAAHGEVARLAPEKKPMKVAGRAITPDGRTVYALGTRDGARWALATWDADTGELGVERPVPDCPGTISTVAVSPDGAHLIAVGKHGVHAWALAPRLAAPIAVAGIEPGTLYEAYVQVLAARGRTLVVACSIYGVVHAFDVAAGTTLLRLKRTRYGKYVALVPARRVFVFPSQAGLWAMSAFDPAASAIVDPAATGDHAVTSVDGAVVAVSCATPAPSGRTTGTVALYPADALPDAAALPVAAADESYRRLGSVKAAFHTMFSGPAAPGAAAVSTAESRATTRVTKKPARKPAKKPKPKPRRRATTRSRTRRGKAP